MAETWLPNPENKIWLDKEKKDQWGLPLVNISFEYGDNEKAMRKDAMNSAQEMLDKAGFKHVKSFDYNPAPGTTVHEMGTARMGFYNRWKLHDIWRLSKSFFNIHGFNSKSMRLCR